MDPLSLSVAALLAKALGGAAEELGGTAADALGRLVGAVRRRFTDEPQAALALAAVERSPADEASVQKLAAAIDERVSGDGGGAFRDELQELVAEVAHHPRVSQFITEARDNARVGKIVNVGQAGDINL